MPPTYPIPGDILDSGDFYGLSYDQLLIIGFAPVIVMMFSIITGVIPLSVSLGLGGLTAIGVLIIVAKTPTGQDPFEWLAAALKRKFSPGTYTLEPVQNREEDIKYLDVVHTSDSLGEFSSPIQTKLADDSLLQEEDGKHTNVEDDSTTNNNK